MADDKQKLRDLFSDKVSGDAPTEEPMAEEEVNVTTEEAPVEEAPMEPEAPAEEAPAEEVDVDIVKVGKDAYMRFEKTAKEDPVNALDILIGELQEIRENQVGDAGGFLPGDEAPLNPPANI